MKCFEDLNPESEIRTELGSPILFRTCNAEVAATTLSTGSLWLRSNRYYQALEDTVRNDKLEGINAAAGGIPLKFNVQNGPTVVLKGDGHVGQEIIPHYLACFHGPSIDFEEWARFGGNTLGIRSISKLAAEVLYQCSCQIACTGYRYGPVSYQHSCLGVLAGTIGSAPIQLSTSPPAVVSPITTDVLRKQPAEPFVKQDEWRIAIFTDGFLNGEPDRPLKIHVDPNHFYSYLLSAESQ
jgi:hypothetical protein